jgi:hypothetical protein
MRKLKLRNKNLGKLVMGCVGITVLAVIIYHFLGVHRRNIRTLTGKNPGDTEKQLQFFIEDSAFRKSPLIYLKAVYPTSDFSKKSKTDLIKLYNSLHMWYNCAAKWGTPTNKFGKGEDDQGSVCWNRLPGCGTTWPEPPFVPIGWIYDWNNYIAVGGNNQRSAESLRVGDQIRWSDGSLDVKDVSASVPSRTYWFWHNGPGPIWMYQRAIFRYLYNPNYGPDLYLNIPPWEPESVLPKHKVKGPWAQPAVDPTPGTNAITDNWSSNMDKSFLFQQPRDWWLGVPSNGWLEVTCASEPGLAPSPPICWFDAWRGSGTWINVGKTVVGRNKVDVVFRLAYEMAETDQGKFWLNQQYNVSTNVDFTTMSSSQVAYEVCRNLLSNIGQSDVCKIRGATVYNARRNALPDNLSAWKSTPRKIQFNFCVSNSNNNMSVSENNSAQKNAFALTTNVLNWEAWCKRYPGNSFEIPDECIDKAKLGTLFTADRQASLMVFDEPLFALAKYLGYDSVQMPHSSNGNGRYQYEYCELRGYPKEVERQIRQRDYSSFMAVYGPSPYQVDYRVDFLIPYFKRLSEIGIFQHRDILDPNNGPSKVMVFDKLWSDSARVNVAYQADNPDVGVLESKDVQWAPATLDNIDILSRKLGRPVLKTADVPKISYLWEYNITAKNHISSMFTKLSVLAFIKNGKFEIPSKSPCDIPDSQKVDCIGEKGADEKTCKSNPRCCYKKSSTPGVPSCYHDKNSVFGQANFCIGGVGEQISPGIFKRIRSASDVPFA